MNEQLPASQSRRWYDSIANMTMALHVSRQLPREIQMIIARNMNEAINDYRKIKRNDKYAVSLGRSRTLGLYQASRRQRWYDSHSDTHRAFNLMTTVPEGFLIEFADRILRVNRYVEEQEKQMYRSDRYVLADTVESILQHNTINLLESDSGIKLVSSNSGSVSDPNRHVLPARRPDRPHSYRRPR